MRGILMLTFTVGAGFTQSFDVASVKASARTLGRDVATPMAIVPTGIIAHNATLKRLIVQAYGVQPYQVTGGPGWLDASEYDVEGKVGAVVSREQLNAMLRTLLAERFHLKVQRQTKELRVYEMVVDAGGLKLRPVEIDDATGGGGFRGTMTQLAQLVSVQLSIPPIDDPSRPSIASGPPVPVVDKTGLDGTYEFPLDLRPEAGTDMFTLWQRKLRDLGLRLERPAGTCRSAVDRKRRQGAGRKLRGCSDSGWMTPPAACDKF